jgi:hypothetical protein
MFLMGGYLGLAYLIQWLASYKPRDPGQNAINRIAACAAFSGAIMVFFGIIEPKVLGLVSIKTYLLLAGFTALLHSMRSLRLKPEDAAPKP